MLGGRFCFLMHEGPQALAWHCVRRGLALMASPACRWGNFDTGQNNCKTQSFCAM